MTQIDRDTQLELKGRGTITLAPDDFVAAGGEGAVYRHKRTVVKLYHDPDAAMQSGVIARLERLSALKHPVLVSPKGSVRDSGGNPIGFYMDHVTGEAFPNVVNTSFWDRNGFTFADANKVVEQMREPVQLVHAAGACLVDANLFNWTLAKSKGGYVPRLFDVDSFIFQDAIPPVVAKMDSIRDWHNELVSPESDWFAWAVVTFNLFTGIHPYKGGLDGYKKAEMERRMRENASVFRPGIRLNAAVRDANKIPSVLRAWYHAVFEQGERSVPPSPFDQPLKSGSTARVLRATTLAGGTGGALRMEKLHDVTNDAAIRVFACGVVQHASGQLYDLATKQVIGAVTSPECEVVSVKEGWLIGQMVDERLRFSFVRKDSLQSEEVSLQTQAFDLVRYENRLFVTTARGLAELSIRVLGRILLSTGNEWGASLNATRWFDGVGIQNTMGTSIIIVPYGANSCAQVRVGELDGLKVVSAKAGNRFIAFVAADKTGQFFKVGIRFTQENYESWEVTKHPVDQPDLNIAMLPQGVVASLVEDGELYLLVSASGGHTPVSDKALTTDMMLANWEQKMVYIQNGAVFRLQKTA